MVDRVEIGISETGPNSPPPTPAEQRPEWQPDGFTGDQKGLAKSWSDQRAEITRLQQENANLKKGTPSAGGQEPPANADPAAGSKTPAPGEAAAPKTGEAAAPQDGGENPNATPKIDENATPEEA